MQLSSASKICLKAGKPAWMRSSKAASVSEARRTSLLVSQFPCLLYAPFACPLAIPSSERGSDCMHYWHLLLCAGWAFPTPAWLIFKPWVWNINWGNSEVWFWWLTRHPCHWVSWLLFYKWQPTFNAVLSVSVLSVTVLSVTVASPNSQTRAYLS